jgi:beta-glucanase (GH16 family)
MRYTRLTALLALFALAASPGCSEEAKPVVWNQVWADEFDGAAGTRLENTKWRYDVGTGWGNNQLEYDTSLASNASLDGLGNLAITARREDYAGQSYTSARVKTKGLFEQTHGRFEARIKLPVGQGIWPAFWLLGSNIDQVGWPTCGEIDIMEYRGQFPRTLVGTIHGPGYSGGNPITQTYTAPAGLDQAFHIYAIEWDATEIKWSIDGVNYHRATPASIPGGTQWVFDHPFFIILNVAVGGNWVGAPNAATVFPQVMLVDYVRVFADAAE